MSVKSFVKNAGYSLAFLQEVHKMLAEKPTDDLLIEKGRELALKGVDLAIRNLRETKNYAELAAKTGTFRARVSATAVE